MKKVTSNNKLLSVRISPWLYRKIVISASAKNMSLPDYVRTVLQRKL